MQFGYFQGIINAQTKPLEFLQLSGNTVILLASKVPVELNFAHGPANYAITIKTDVTSAWTGFNSVAWLYWDIDLETSALTYGFSNYAPKYGTAYPSSPQVGQHFFDTLKNKMYFWNGEFWIEVVRLFAGQINNGKVMPNAFSSQVNRNVPCISGNILYDFKKRPIKVFDQDGTFHFLTDAIYDNFTHTNKDNFQFGRVKLNSIANDNLVIHHTVRWNDDRKIIAASYLDLEPASALVARDVTSGDIVEIITRGFVKNVSWRWPYAPNTPLFVGLQGELSVIVPTQGSIQYVGYIVNPTTIFLNFDRQILINPVDVSPTPSRTPTQTPTPTVTPSHTAAPTPTPTTTHTAPVTPTPTRTPTQTATVTPTPSITATPTQTPTPTPTSSPPLPSVTPTPSTTPTLPVTPSMTASITPTVTPTITQTPTITPTVTQTVTPTASHTPTPSVTPTNSPTPSVTPTNTPTPSVTATITPSPTATVTPTITPSVTPS